MKIIKGDTVLVISGKYKGKKNKILKTLPKKGKVLVEGINLAKKHRKGRRTGEKGQIIELPQPMDISNVKLICPKCSKATRVGYKMIGQKKVRICKKCNKKVK